MRRAESECPWGLSVTFLADGGNLFVVTKFFAGGKWEKSAIEIDAAVRSSADLPTFREQLAEVEAEAHRLDEQYPPGSPVALNPPADAA